MSENRNQSMGQSKYDDIQDLFVQMYANYVDQNPYNGGGVNDKIDQALLNMLSFNDNSAKFIYDQPIFQILKVSTNVEDVSGIPEEDVNNFGKVIAYLSPDSFKFLLQIAEHHIVTIMDSISKKHNFFQVTVCGLTVMGRNGKAPNRLLMQYTPFQFNETGEAQLGLGAIHRVNFMLKSDIMWARLVHGEDTKEVTFISTEDLKYQNKDILSERELEILKCIAEGMDTEDVAKTLFISPHTIKNHRKNMLARTGLCDTTALIQVCRICGILK